jgi:hypothetical protein
MSLEGCLIRDELTLQGFGQTATQECRSIDQPETWRPDLGDRIDGRMSPRLYRMTGKSAWDRLLSLSSQVGCISDLKNGLNQDQLTIKNRARGPGSFENVQR